MISKKDKKIKELPVVWVLGKKCWTPATFAKVLGVNRNTVINWARKTKKGELDMPIISAPVPRAKIYIKADEAIEWVNFGATA